MNFNHYSPKRPDFSRVEDVIAWLRGEFRNFFDSKGDMRPSQEQVLNVLRTYPELVEKIVQRNVAVENLHDVVIIEEVKDGYDVYVADRGKKVDATHFTDLWSALDDYLKSLGLRKNAGHHSIG